VIVFFQKTFWRSIRTSSEGPCRRTRPADSQPDWRCLPSSTNKAGVGRTNSSSSGYRIPHSFTSAACAAKPSSHASILIGISKGNILHRIRPLRQVGGLVPPTGAATSCRCRRVTTWPSKTSRTTGRGAEITLLCLALPPKPSTLGFSARTAFRVATPKCRKRKRGVTPSSKAASHRIAHNPLDWSSKCAVHCLVTTVSTASSRSIQGWIPIGGTHWVTSLSNGKPGTLIGIAGDLLVPSSLSYLSACTRRAQSCTGFGSDGFGNSETPSQHSLVVDPAPFESPQHGRTARPSIPRSGSKPDRCTYSTRDVLYRCTVGMAMQLLFLASLPREIS
jgi:hypothetical protein